MKGFNQTLYLSAEDRAFTVLATKIAAVNGESLSKICARAIRKYVDDNQSLCKVIEQAMKGTKKNGK